MSPIVLSLLFLLTSNVSSLTSQEASSQGEGPRWLPHATGSTASLRGLHAIDARVCWASGARGTVLRTVDGGTWTKVPVPGAGELDFRDVHAFDEERALVVSAGAPARIYRTEDGGGTWEMVYENLNAAAFFDAFDFWDEQRGLAFSDPIDGKLLVIVTADGGRTWTPVPPASLPESPAGEAGFAASGTCLTTGGARRAWIGLGGIRGARVFRTLDGGATWTASGTPLLSGEPSAGIFSLAMFGEERGVAVGGDYDEPNETEGNAAITTDGGATWQLVTDAPPTGYRSCVAVIAGSSGPTLVAVGPNGSDLSTDGGASWKRLSRNGYHAVSSAADGSVWASGAGGKIARLELPSVRKSVGTAAWNRFRGPNGTGVAAGGSYPAEIGPEQGVVWKRAFPTGHSSPVLSAEHVFLTGVEDERLFTYAVERATGETVWKREAPRERRTTFHAKNGPAGASAAVDADTIVVFFDEYGLLAYDHDGTERWRVPLGPFDNVYGMGASPVIVGAVIVLACDQSTKSYVIAVAKDDGRTLWREKRPQAISGHCTPVVWRTARGRDEVLLPGSFLLDAYDAQTGKRVWWVKGLPSEMKSVPVLDGDTLWIHGFASPLNNRGNQIEFPAFAEGVLQMDADGDGKITRTELQPDKVQPYYQFLDLDADGALNAEEWEMMRANFSAVNSAMALKVGGEGDVTESNVLWRHYRDVPQLPSPLVYGGVYYMLADQGGLVTTLAPDTGEKLEKGRLEDAIDNYFASPVAGDGKVYLLSEAGILTVLGQGKGLEPIHTADFREQCYATPALEDDRLWLRTEGRLFCFGER